jgi:hypothetical protein
MAKSLSLILIKSEISKQDWLPIWVAGFGFLVDLEAADLEPRWQLPVPLS